MQFLVHGCWPRCAPRKEPRTKAATQSAIGRTTHCATREGRRVPTPHSAPRSFVATRVGDVVALVRGGLRTWRFELYDESITWEAEFRLRQGVFRFHLPWSFMFNPFNGIHCPFISAIETCQGFLQERIKSKRECYHSSLELNLCHWYDLVVMTSSDLCFVLIGKLWGWVLDSKQVICALF